MFKINDAGIINFKPIQNLIYLMFFATKLNVFQFKCGQYIQGEIIFRDGIIILFGTLHLLTQKRLLLPSVTKQLLILAFVFGFCFRCEGKVNNFKYLCL